MGTYLCFCYFFPYKKILRNPEFSDYCIDSTYIKPI